MVVQTIIRWKTSQAFFDFRIISQNVVRSGLLHVNDKIKMALHGIQLGRMFIFVDIISLLVSVYNLFVDTLSALLKKFTGGVKLKHSCS